MESSQPNLPEICQSLEALIDRLEADGVHQASETEQLATTVKLLEHRADAQEREYRLLRSALDEAEQVIVSQQKTMAELTARIDEHDRIASVQTRSLDRMARLN